MVFGSPVLRSGPRYHGKCVRGRLRVRAKDRVHLEVEVLRIGNVVFLASPHANPGVGGGVVPELPAHPNLDHLRHQARDLLHAAVAGEESARQRIGRVSDRLNLTAAQLAIAREYGLASWRGLVVEVGRRREAGNRPADPDPAASAPALLGSSARNASWSAGAPIPIPAGTLHPRSVVVEAGRGVLRVGLDVAEEHPGVVVPRRDRWLSVIGRASRAKALGEAMPRLDGLTVVDSSGVHYAWREGARSGMAQMVGRRRVPRHVEYQLRLDPAPDPDAAWIELIGPEGARTRLVRGERAEARAVGPTPNQSSTETSRVESMARSLIAMALNGASIGSQFIVEQSARTMAQIAEMESDGPPIPPVLKQELAALCRYLSEGTIGDDALRPAWKSMLDAGELRDGLRPSANLDTSLPVLDGVALRLAVIIFEEASWALHVHAAPDWWAYSEDRRLKQTVVDVEAEDDIGGTYVSLGGGGSRTSDPDPGYDAVLRFRPRLDPGAQRLRLTVRGATEHVVVDVGLPHAITT